MENRADVDVGPVYSHLNPSDTPLVANPRQTLIDAGASRNEHQTSRPARTR